MRKPRLRDVDGTEYDQETGARNNLSEPFYFATLRADTIQMWQTEMTDNLHNWWQENYTLRNAVKGTK